MEGNNFMMRDGGDLESPIQHSDPSTWMATAIVASHYSYAADHTSSAYTGFIRSGFTTFPRAVNSLKSAGITLIDRDNETGSESYSESPLYIVSLRIIVFPFKSAFRVVDWYAAPPNVVGLAYNSRATGPIEVKQHSGLVYPASAVWKTPPIPEALRLAFAYLNGSAFSPQEILALFRLDKDNAEGAIRRLRAPVRRKSVGNIDHRVREVEMLRSQIFDHSEVAFLNKLKQVYLDIEGDVPTEAIP